jgi:hypothetical protein
VEGSCEHSCEPKKKAGNFFTRRATVDSQEGLSVSWNLLTFTSSCPQYHLVALLVQVAGWLHVIDAQVSLPDIAKLSVLAAPLSQLNHVV